jgi:cardiolipin synthase
MDALYWSFLALAVLLALFSAGHALLYKRDPRAAWGWIAVCLISPVAGPLLYLLFGVNRIQTRARKLHAPLPAGLDGDKEQPPPDEGEASPRCPVPPEFSQLARTSDAVTRHPLVGGNVIEVYHNGEQAYPAMLEAIAGAKSSLFLSTYIFGTDHAGRRFIDELARAAGRGVDVRVIVDGIGELYTFPRVSPLLKKRGVRVVRFLPPKLVPPSIHVNLRNHRKILVADGRTAFTGGMNIGDRHLAGALDNPGRVVDAHFRLRGPVVRQIEQVFLDDWEFVTGAQTPPGPTPVDSRGGAICGTITEGPDEDLDSLAAIFIGAVSSARRKVSIMTPYFIPPRELTAALQAAALRGVEVSVILPAKNNLPFVHWATRNLIWEILKRDVHVYYQPPPFAHTKIFLVDDHYAQIGSANVDPRSFRLNFELVVGVYDRAFAETLASHFAEVKGRSREVSLEEVDSRSIPVRLRDSLAWLFSPYL